MSSTVKFRNPIFSAARMTPWKVGQSENFTGNLCEYIVLAEFDIDTGSTVRHMFPSPIPNYAADWFAENMLPEGVHNRSIDYTYMFLNRNGLRSNDSLANLQGMGQQSTDSNHFLYGINLCCTKHDSTVKRGAIVKAMAIFSRYNLVEFFKRPLDIALERYFDERRVEVLQDLFESLNRVDLSTIPCPSPLEQSLMKRENNYESLGVVPEEYTLAKWTHEVKMKLMSKRYDDEGQPSTTDSSTPDLVEVELAFNIPLYVGLDEVGDISVVTLVRTFGDATMRIFNAVLAKQRILFVGYNHAAYDVAQMALSTVALVSPPFSNTIRRTYPYANFTDLSFLEVPGYIAGVTNPMFQEHDSWWDLLCVLDLPNSTGSVRNVEEKRSEDQRAGGPNSSKSPPHPGHSHIVPDDSYQVALDHKFIAGVISGINAGIGEAWVRQRFHDYTMAIVNQAHVQAYLLEAQQQQQQQQHQQQPQRSQDTGSGLALEQAAAAMGGGLGVGAAAGSGEPESPRERVGQWVASITGGATGARLSAKMRRQVEGNARRCAALLRDPELLASLPPHPWAWLNAAPAVRDEANGKSTETTTTEGVSASTQSNELEAMAVAVGTMTMGGGGGGGDDAGDEEEEEDGELTVSTATAASGSAATEPTSLSSSPSATRTAPASTASASTDSTLSLSSPSSSRHPSLEEEANADPGDGVVALEERSGGSTVVGEGVSPEKFDGMQLKSFLLRLQMEEGLHPVHEVEVMFKVLDDVLVSEGVAQGLLALLPESSGGVHPIAVGLFHPNPAVRLHAGNILMKMDGFESTRPVVRALNGMLKGAYERNRIKVLDGSIEGDIDTYRAQQARHRESLVNQQHQQQQQLGMGEDPHGGDGPLGGSWLSTPVPVNLHRTPSDTTINALDMIP